jgi:hypothetical protein
MNQQDLNICKVMQAPMNLGPLRISEHAACREAADRITTAPAAAWLDFATFLKSPGITAAILKASEPSTDHTTVKNAATPDAVAKALLVFSSDARQRLAKEIKALLGAKTQIVVDLGNFRTAPRTAFEKSEINAVAQEFKQFLESKWKEGSYLKLEP